MGRLKTAVARAWRMKLNKERGRKNLTWVRTAWVLLRCASPDGGTGEGVINMIYPFFFLRDVRSVTKFKT
jgi:hypothetical protein